MANREKPTKKFKRRRTWFLWRFYGMTVVAAARKIHNTFGGCHLVPNTRNNWPPTIWERDFAFWDKFKDWCWHPKGRLVDYPFRLFLHNLFWPCHNCPHCNSDSFIYDDFNTELISESSCSEFDSWTEWRACVRCGFTTIHQDST